MGIRFEGVPRDEASPPDRHATLTAFSATPALADSIGPGDTEIELELTSVGPNRAVLAYFNDGSTVYNRVVSAGTLNWTGGLTSFCVQLLEGATVGQTRTFDVVDLEDVPEALPGPARWARPEPRSSETCSPATTTAC